MEEPTPSPTPDPIPNPEPSPTPAPEPTPEPTPGPPGAPEVYDLKPQEGEAFADGFLDAYTKSVRELNLTNDGAQKLLDDVGPSIAAAQLAKVEAVKEGWKAACEADKEFGGDGMKENLAVARKGLEAFGSPELAKFIGETGLGSHPEIVRLFWKLGQTVKEDTILSGASPGKEPPKDFAGRADALYPGK